MYMTVMKASRLLTNAPLDEIAQAIRISKSRVSVIERFPHGAISSKLKQRIEKHFGLSFDLLARPIDGAEVVELLKQLVQRTDVGSAE